MLCTFLLIGIIFAYLFHLFLPIHYVIVAIFIALAVLLIKEKAFNVVFLLAVIFLGIFLYGQGIIGDRLLENVGPTSMMRAKILKGPSLRGGYTQYEIEIINIFLGGQNRAIKVDKRANLNIYESSTEFFLDDFTRGDIIEVRNATIKKLLEDYKKDDVNGYELYLKSKGFEYIINTKSKDITKYNMDIKYTDILNISYRVKVYIEDYLDATLEFENSDILKSIIFGNQGYLSRDRLEIFSKTGTAHIMAVSGLHVGLMVLIADRLLRLLKIGKNNRLYLTTIILLFYSYIVYFPVSIVRAGAMYFLYVISYFLCRRYDSINALFFIAFIILIYNPISIFSVSFQLSFVATLSILMFGPILNSKLKNVLGFLAPLLSVTLAAQIGTLPIMAYHFNQVSLISLVTNMLIIPLIAPMLSVAFISISVGSVWFKLGFFINQITDNILNCIKWISVKSAAIPYASMEIGDIKFTYIFLYYAILVFIYFIYNKYNSQGSKKSESDSHMIVKA